MKHNLPQLLQSSHTVLKHNSAAAPSYIEEQMAQDHPVGLVPKVQLEPVASKFIAWYNLNQSGSHFKLQLFLVFSVSL